MNSKIEKYFYKKYPLLFQDHSKPMTETCMCWGIGINDGWIFLLDHLCESITSHIKSQHDSVDWEDDYEKENGDNLSRKRPDWSKIKMPQVIFDQVKEKYSEIRIYYTGGDDIIKGFVDYAERISGYICEECGRFDETVGKTTKGWIHTICEDCALHEKGYIKNNGWQRTDKNKELTKLLKQSRIDREKNKDKEMVITLRKIAEIKSRSKKKK
jgi:hypothetical protein